MATVRVDLDVTSKGEASLKSAATGLDGVGSAAKRADAAVNQWSNSQQRAAQRMERMQEAAIKMNTGFASSDDKAQLFSATLGKMSTAMTTTAAAFGLPIGPLTALNSATEVSALGFGQLTKSAVGFNAASVVVVGAGLGLGAMLGTLLREIPAVSSAMDKWADSVNNFFNIWQRGAPAAAGFTERMAASNEQAQKRQTAVLRGLGMSLEDIRKHYESAKTGIDKYVDGLKKQEEAEKKASEEAKKNAQETAKDIDAAWKMQHEFSLQMDKRYLAAFKAGNEAKHKQVLEDSAEEEKAAVARWEGEKAAWEAFMEALGKWHDDNEKAREEESKGLGDQQALYGEIANTLETLGVSGSNVFVQIARGIEQGTAALVEFKKATNDSERAVAGMHAAQAAYNSGSVLGGAAAGASFGAAFGPLGMGIGAVAGGLLGLFGHAKKVREEMQKMREEFIRSEGGLDALRIAAEHSGISLQALFDAKNAKQLSAAIDEIKRKLDTTAEAERKLKEAMDRYGITIEEMGPKFAQQELDKQALQLWQDYQLLIAAGADVNAVLAKMGPSMNEYVQTALKAGATIPESMKPILQALIDQGLLLDASGNAYKSLEEAGLTFGQTLEESMASVVESIKQLIAELARLYGLPPINIPVNVTGGGSGTTPTGYPPGREPKTFALGGRVETDPEFRVPGTHGGQLAIVHPGETIIPAASFGDLSSFVSNTFGGSAAAGGGGRRETAAALDRLSEAVEKRGAPVNVNVAVPVDASTTTTAHRQQFIDDVGVEVGRSFQPGGRNYRNLIRAVKSAQAGG